MRRLLIVMIVMALVGCIPPPSPTPIRSVNEATPVPQGNVFYKSEHAINNVIFLRDQGFVLEYSTAYLFLKIGPRYKKVKLANINAGEVVGFFLKEGEYCFLVECNPYVGKIENEIFEKIERNKIYYFRITPIHAGGFQIQRVGLEN